MVAFLKVLLMHANAPAFAALVSEPLAEETAPDLAEAEASTSPSTLMPSTSVPLVSPTTRLSPGKFGSV